MSAGTDWVDGYVRAWESNDPDDIAAIFTEDAVYEFSPDDPDALRGRDAIIAGWLDSKDEPGDWTFDWEVLVEAPDLVVVQGRTDYPADKLYDNLWVIRLDPDAIGQPRPQRDLRDLEAAVAKLAIFHGHLPAARGKRSKFNFAPTIGDERAASTRTRPPLTRRIISATNRRAA